MDPYNSQKQNDTIINYLYRTSKSHKILPSDISNLISKYGDGCLFDLQGNYLRHEDYNKIIFDMDWKTPNPTNEQELTDEVRDIITDDFDLFQDDKKYKRKDIINLFEKIAIKTLNTNAIIGVWPDNKYILRFGFSDGDNSYLIIKPEEKDINNRFFFYFFQGEDNEKDDLLYGFL